MTTHINRCRRRVASWTTLLTFTASSLCFAQVPDGSGEQPAQMAIRLENTQDVTAPPLPRSRRVLTAEELSTLVGQTLSLGVRTRWPRRIVKGTVVAVDSDTVSVDTGKGIVALPISRTVVVSSLPGDFVTLMGQEITVSTERRFPPTNVTGRVAGVDATHVTIASDTGLHRLPIGSSAILSRAPARDRRRATIATIASVIGVHLWVALRCRGGGC